MCCERAAPCRNNGVSTSTLVCVESAPSPFHCYKFLDLDLFKHLCTTYLCTQCLAYAYSFLDHYLVNSLISPTSSKCNIGTYMDTILQIACRRRSAWRHQGHGSGLLLTCKLSALCTTCPICNFDCHHLQPSLVLPAAGLAAAIYTFSLSVADL